MWRAIALAVAPFLVLSAASWTLGRPEVVVTARCSVHNWIWRRALVTGRLGPDMERRLVARSYSAANVFPLYPGLLAVTTKLLGDTWVSAWVVNLVLACVGNAFFYMLCRAMRVRKPVLFTAMFAFFPPRAILLRYVGNEYNLVVALVALLFLAKRGGRHGVLSLSICLLIITSEVGIVVALFLVVEALVRRDFVVAGGGAVGGGVGIAMLMMFQGKWLGSYTAYFDEVVAQKRYPFAQLIEHAKKIVSLRPFHGAYGFYIVPVICGLVLMKRHSDMALPLLMALVWSSSRSGQSAFDVGCPMVPFLVIFGAMRLFQGDQFRKAMYIIAPAYSIAYLWLTCEHLQYL